MLLLLASRRIEFERPYFSYVSLTSKRNPFVEIRAEIRAKRKNEFVNDLADLAIEAQLACRASCRARRAEESRDLRDVTSLTLMQKQQHTQPSGGPADSDL